jgi:hypothetical protein
MVTQKVGEWNYILRDRSLGEVKFLTNQFFIYFKGAYSEVRIAMNRLSK